MFEEEEKRLATRHVELNQLQIPEEALTQAIRAGLSEAERRARRRSQRVRKSLLSAAAVALLLIAFVTSVRVLPAFANAVASLPGMSVIVDMIRHDKGMRAIIDNEYYEDVQASDSHGGVTVTLNGVIVDQSGMVISYTVDSAAPLKDPLFETPEIYADGKLIEPQGIAWNDPVTSNSRSSEQSINYHFADPLPINTKNFELKMQIRDGDTYDFRVPFEIQKPIAQGKVHELNRTVTIEGQKIIVKSVTIHPLRVEVAVDFDEANTMDILQFEDMRIENGKGETWSSITDGMTATEDEDGTQIYFLQSNYFEQPDLMIFRMNKMQAIDKDEQFIVDTGTGEVIQTPSDGKLEVTAAVPLRIETKLRTDGEFGYGYLKSAADANGKAIDLSSAGLWYSHDEEGEDRRYTYNDLNFTDANYANPVTVSFFAYPNYIKGDVTLRLE
ncbi:DUF4179 domain-containing protein [Bhargavaea cecembensis]|uniref:DUF4179 domain-containing protein n=1 Tax=Bhargavaea cecembensis TaxID=394098 RepID=UPI00059163F7|nr:DUF4179 domain-containing protein [Bhargavaea cecembensis]